MTKDQARVGRQVRFTKPYSAGLRNPVGRTGTIVKVHRNSSQWVLVSFPGWEGHNGTPGTAGDRWWCYPEELVVVGDEELVRPFG